jgi:thiol-disulfide isomerase/thioredoxin
MSNKFMVGVPYLEDSDINPDASLKAHVNNGKPVVMMIYGLFCPHCKKAMPAYEQLANSLPNVTVVAVQTDGGPNDKKAAQMLSAVNKSPGVPTFLGFNKEGKFVKTHNGGRDLEALKQFAQSL